MFLFLYAHISRETIAGDDADLTFMFGETANSFLAYWGKNCFGKCLETSL